MRLETRYGERDPKTLRLLEKNAHYMPAAKYARLVANLKRDGVCTSSVLIHTGELVDDEGRVLGKNDSTVLSGNHRVKACIDAEIAKVLVIEIIGQLTRKRATAIALSHNALTGDDDPNILQELYSSLDYIEKQYSGLTDDSFKGLLSIDVSSLAIGGMQQEEVSLQFLPEDAKQFVDLVKKLQARGKKLDRYIARLADFDRFFDTVVKVKDQKKIHNTAMAILMMAELAAERLEQIAPEVDDEQRTEPAERAAE